jgi:hypothetical protein
MVPCNTLGNAPKCTSALHTGTAPRAVAANFGHACCFRTTSRPAPGRRIRPAQALECAHECTGHPQ